MYGLPLNFFLKKCVYCLIDSDYEIQFDGPQEHPNPFQVENENGEFDNFDEMLNKKTEKNLKKLLKGKEDTIEASKSMISLSSSLL